MIYFVLFSKICSIFGGSICPAITYLIAILMDYHLLPPVRHVQVGIEIGGSRRLQRNKERRKKKANATSIVKRKRKRIGMGLSTQYRQDRKQKNEIRRAALSPANGGLNSQHHTDFVNQKSHTRGPDRFGISPKYSNLETNNGGSVILNRLSENISAPEDFLVNSGKVVPSPPGSLRSDLSPTPSITNSKRQLGPKPGNIVRIRGRTSWGKRAEKDVAQISGTTVRVIQEEPLKQHESFSHASLEEEFKLCFVPRERNPVIERTKLEDQQVSILNSRLTNMTGKIKSSLDKLGIFPSAKGTVSMSHFRKIGKELNMAPKYLDQLVYGKVGACDENGHVNLVALGIMKPSGASPMRNKLGQNSGPSLNQTNKFNSPIYMNARLNVGVKAKKGLIKKSSSLPALKQKNPNFQGGLQTSKPPWKRGLASARWGEETYKSTFSLTQGQRGTDLYKENNFERENVLFSEIDQQKKEEFKKHKKALYNDQKEKVKTRKAQEHWLQKHLEIRKNNTILRQSKRYENFLSKERIRRATRWTDSGKHYQSGLPQRLEHRKHQYKQVIDDGSYTTAMGRRNGLKKWEWERVFKKSPVR